MEMNDIMIIETFFSRSNSNANASMNMIQVDLVIVYNEIVINSKLQLEKPISNADAMPGNDILRIFSFQCNVILDIP